MAINRVSGLVLPYSTKFLIDTVIAKHHAERLRPLVILVLCATIIFKYISRAFRLHFMIPIRRARWCPGL